MSLSLNEKERKRLYNIKDFEHIMKRLDTLEVDRMVNTIVLKTVIKGNDSEKFDYVEEAIKYAWTDYKLFPNLTDNQILEVLSHFDVWGEFVSKARLTPELLKNGAKKII